MSGDPIRKNLPDGSYKVYEKQEVKVPTDGNAFNTRKTRLPRRSRAQQINLHAVANKTSAPNQNFKVYKLDELRLSSEQFTEAKKQILELYKANTFNPFKGVQLSDAQKQGGFLAEPSSFKKYQIQQAMSASIELSRTDHYNYPFFVAVNIKDNNKIIGVMHPSMTQEFMHAAVSSIPQIKTDLTEVVERLIESNKIPGMTSTNTWHNGGVAIDPSFKGQGVAKALFEQKVRWMKTTQAEDARFLLFGYDAENIASKKYHAKLNTLALDDAFSEYSVANRPHVLKVLDLQQPLFKEA